MTSLRTLAMVLSAAIFCMLTGAAYQDPSLKPNKGTVKLKAGFMPDPYKVKVEAGGNIKVEKEKVTAWITSNPDFILEYEAGDVPLTIHAESKVNSTLFILAPDAQWYANDDRGPGNFNPLIRFAKPMSGKYTIWVGIHGGLKLEENRKVIVAPAELFITERAVVEEKKGNKKD